MNVCPRCKIEFIPGKWKNKYCSRICANSRCWSNEDKNKKSSSAKKFIDTLSENKKNSMTANAVLALIEQRKERISYGNFDDLGQKEKRERLLIEQKFLCSECNIGLTWNNKPIKFQLDHINGNRKDETRNNLRMICPNCHSQTDTFGGKNGRKITNKQIEEELQTSENNHHVCIKLGLNPSSYTYERINKIRNKLL